ncbi:MAG: chemotaxis protein CheB [Ignavibacteria bacterium]|nr:chemotaxis protein CheB [Ignavibacteria bacterium]
MSELKKILIAEDELTNSILLKRVLTKAGYSVVVAHNGLDAYKHLECEQFDALLTDWMMPNMDGIELIRRTRQNISPVPLIIMITSLVSDGARTYSLESGADDYIAKPFDLDELLIRLKDGLHRKTQDAPKKISSIISRSIDVRPPFVGVVVATSTGGPPTLLETFRNIPANTNAAFYLVQHGPSWMLDTFAQRLQRESMLTISLASNGAKSEAGNVYIAPGDKHLRIAPGTFNLILDDGPKENFVRPAADPLFRSAAEAFGKYCIAVVLTGLGRYGAQGAAQIASTQGTVLVQDPETCIAPSMPKTVIEADIQHRVVPLSNLCRVIIETIQPLSEELKEFNSK